MSTISVSVYQRSSSFSIFLYATTANGVVFLPITLQQFKSLFGSCIGCSIQPGQHTYYFQCLYFWYFIGLFVTIIYSVAWLFHDLICFIVVSSRINDNYYGRWILKLITATKEIVWCNFYLILWSGFFVVFMHFNLL